MKQQKEWRASAKGDCIELVVRELNEDGSVASETVHNYLDDTRAAELAPEPAPEPGPNDVTVGLTGVAAQGVAADLG